MKFLVLWTIALSILVVGCTKEPEKDKMGLIPPKSEPQSAGLLSAGNEIKDVLIRQIAAQNREDVDGYLATIDPSAPVYASTRTAAEDLFEKYDLEVTLDNMDVVDVSDEEAQIRISITTVKKAGPDFQNNRLTAINKLRKVDGKWLMYSTEIEKLDKVP